MLYWLVAIFTIPLFAYAQTTLNSLVQDFGTFFLTIPSIIIGVAVVFFMWQMLKFVRIAQSDEERSQAKAMMVYALAAIFVMVSLWGIIALLVGILQLDNSRGADFEEIIYDPPL